MSFFFTNFTSRWENVTSHSDVTMTDWNFIVKKKKAFRRKEQIDRKNGWWDKSYLVTVASRLSTKKKLNVIYHCHFKIVLKPNLKPWENFCCYFASCQSRNTVARRASKAFSHLPCCFLTSQCSLNLLWPRSRCVSS